MQAPRRGRSPESVSSACEPSGRILLLGVPIVGVCLELVGVGGQQRLHLQRVGGLQGREFYGVTLGRQRLLGVPKGIVLLELGGVGLLTVRSSGWRGSPPAGSSGTGTARSSKPPWRPSAR